jgi:hypothetical protein
MSDVLDQLTRALADRYRIERTLRQVEIAVTLQHPLSPRLSDSGAAAGVVFYVVQDVEGEPLLDQLNPERQAGARPYLACGPAPDVRRGTVGSLESRAASVN